MFERRKILKYFLNLLADRRYWALYFKLFSDKLRGLDFHRNVYKQELGIPAELQPANYEPSLRKPLKTVMKDLGISPGDSIIDLGCGKGKVLSIMSEYPFSRIVGIEYSKPVYDIAMKNLKAFRSGRIEVLFGDAGEFKDLDAFSFIYMYNPFGEILLKKVIENVLGSFSRSPRKIYIIYANPVHENVISEYKQFVLFRKYDFKKFETISVYLIKPDAR